MVVHRKSTIRPVTGRVFVGTATLSIGIDGYTMALCGPDSIGVPGMLPGQISCHIPMYWYIGNPIVEWDSRMAYSILNVLADGPNGAKADTIVTYRNCRCKI